MRSLGRRTLRCFAKSDRKMCEAAIGFRFDDDPAHAAHKKRRANHIASDNAGVPGKELAVHQISTAPKRGASKKIPALAAKGQSTKAKLISIAALPAELG